jgi:two-component system, cell cycle sensor histidine kinase and response regulator CckA
MLPTTERRSLVLVADDEEAIQLLVARVVHQLGFVVLRVDDGAAAVAAVQAHREHLACVILDIVMPVMDGVEAAQAIQRLTPELAIVLMSSAIPLNYANAITGLRLVGILRKPFPLIALRQLVLQAVGNAGTPGKDGSYAAHT